MWKWDEKTKFSWNDIFLIWLKQARKRDETIAATENPGRWYKSLLSNPSAFCYDDLKK